MQAIRAIFGVWDHVDTSIDQKLVSEFPEVYHADGKDNDRNDLLPMCATVGAVEMICNFPTERVAPKTWKSNLPKETKTAQIIRKLSKDPNEKIVLDSFLTYIQSGRTGKQFEKDQSHGLDAAGIGLWKLGR